MSRYEYTVAGISAAQHTGYRRPGSGRLPSSLVVAIVTSSKIVRTRKVGKVFECSSKCPETRCLLEDFPMPSARAGVVAYSKRSTV